MRAYGAFRGVLCLWDGEWRGRSEENATRAQSETLLLDLGRRHGAGEGPGEGERRALRSGLGERMANGSPSETEILRQEDGERHCL